MGIEGNHGSRYNRLLHELILESCNRFGDKEALVGNGGTGNHYSYKKIADLIIKLSSGLAREGVKPGDRIGLLAENAPEWGIAYLSIIASGAIVVPLDPSLKDNEIIRFFRVSEISRLVCSEKWFDSALEMIKLNGFDIKAYHLDPEVDRSIFKIDEGTSPDVNIKPDDTAVIIYTSGTTGDPKGVILTHINLVANVTQIIGTLDRSERDILLSLLPLHHTLEATVGLLFALASGMKVVYARALNTRDILEDIKNNKVTLVVAVPLLYEKLYNTISRKIKNLPNFKQTMFRTFFSISQFGWKIGWKVGRTLFASFREKAGLDSVELLVSGGAPLPTRVAEWFNMIGFLFLEGYGLTECAPVVSVNRPKSNVFGSVGPPLPDVEVEIDNPDSTGVGEIRIRGYNVTPGYLDNPEATAAVIRDGWFYSGDLGKIVNGNLYITGRQKNMIVTGGGKNVYPEEIESELNLSDYVLEAIIVGRKRGHKAGEEIWAIVVPDYDRIGQLLGVDPKSLIAEKVHDLIDKEVKEVNKRLADYKRIEKIEIRTEEFQKTSTRKIKRALYE